MIEKVTGYKTVDGTIFENLDAARQHHIRQNLVGELVELFEAAEIEIDHHAAERLADLIAHPERVKRFTDALDGDIK